MQLKDLYKNFGESTPEEQAAFIAAYRLRRASDLAVSPTVQKRQPTTKPKATPKLALSEEEKALMKMLGLKQKVILAARQLRIDDAGNNDDSTLLNDNTFEEGDE